MADITPSSNLVLIGMPGVGKSTIGVLLAKALSRAFIDTDILIQAREGRRLQDIIDSEGPRSFCAIEERHALTLECRGHVIATGGSVVHSPRAMAHLRGCGVIVHLYLPFERLQRRIENLDARGVVMEPGESLRTLYEKRLPLYGRYADCTVDCSGLNHEEVVEEVISATCPSRK